MNVGCQKILQMSECLSLENCLKILSLEDFWKSAENDWVGKHL